MRSLAAKELGDAIAVGALVGEAVANALVVEAVGDA